MFIEIDLRFLIQHRITAHQFIIIKLLCSKRYIMLKQYIAHVNGLRTIEYDLHALQSAGFIDSSYHINNIITYETIPVTDAFRKTQLVDATVFDELYAAYPIKVTRPDGTQDYLRGDKAHNRRIYENITHNNPNLHKHILGCLKREIEDKTNTGKLQYMKRLSTWLTSEGWKAYDDIQEETTPSIKISTYGTDLV